MSDAAAFGALHPALQHQIVNHYQWPGLRPVQAMSVGPVLAGDNVVILAPTAGGKTEAAFFPVLSRVLFERWSGLSVLYISPIRALLNNQLHRLQQLTELLGLRAQTWHGDISQSVKGRIRKDPPDVLLTTPESLEAMLISVRTSNSWMFQQLQVVVIDEVHAFAGADRGWHLLGVLERLAAVSGRDLQRIGLSATVGNRTEIVRWLSTGSARGQQTVDPPRPPAPDPQVRIDYVGSLPNAATVISRLHPNQKRLAFCDSRAQAEQLTRALRQLETEAHVLHSSLSAEERARTEQAFEEGGASVIVATSALELGIDIGDLDRVLQLEAPGSVASFLQRMGRTGRRAGTTANCLFLCTKEESALTASAIVDLWVRGIVEPVVAPAAPFAVLAQQMLALCLERPGLSTRALLEALAPLAEAGAVDAEELRSLLDHLVAADWLAVDGIRVGMGRKGEETFGRKHFLELVSVFTSPRLFRVMQGTYELGMLDPLLFLEDTERTPALLLAGRTWRLLDIDWKSMVVWVEPIDAPGRVQFLGEAADLSYAVARAHRDVLLGSTRSHPHWSQRTAALLEPVCDNHPGAVAEGTLVGPEGRHLVWWTFAGTRINRTLARLLRDAEWPDVQFAALRITMNGTLPDAVARLRRLVSGWQGGGLPTIQIEPDDQAVRQFKFAMLLPPPLLARTLRARLYDEAGAQALVDDGVTWVG